MSFIDHATAYGLIIDDLFIDGNWHRVRTQDKPRKRNGAYTYDGRTGAVVNWATMDRPSRYVEGHTGPRPSPERRRQLDRERRERQHREEIRHEDAVRTAEKLLSEAAYQEHPYLADKGFPEAKGYVHDGKLLVPMRDILNYRKRLVGLQLISDEGKKFLPGTKAKGAIFKIGPDSASHRWLCEGYATALSIVAAITELRSSAQVVVCFSAGNLPVVAEAYGKGRVTYVMADNDASKAGQEAAERTGLRWGMPEEVGTDANDLHRLCGLRALCNLIMEIRCHVDA